MDQIAATGVAHVVVGFGHKGFAPSPDLVIPLVRAEGVLGDGHLAIGSVVGDVLLVAVWEQGESDRLARPDGGDIEFVNARNEIGVGGDGWLAGCDGITHV